MLFVVGIMSFVGLNAAYLVWVERKGAARFQRRPGPTEVGWAGLLQPIADAAKLMSKQLIVPAGVDTTLFRVAPLLMMSPALMSLAVIPWGQHLAARNINVGLLMIFAFGSINVMAIMLGGWSSRNKYAIISAARVVSQNVAYEIPMLLVVITMIMVTGTMNLNEIVVQQAGGVLALEPLPGVGQPPDARHLPHLLHLHAGGDQPRSLRHGRGRERAGRRRLHRILRDGVRRILHGRVCQHPARLRPGHGAVPGRLAEPDRPPAGQLAKHPRRPARVFWFLVKMYFLVFSVVWIRWTFPRTQFYGLLNLSWKILIPVSLFTLILSSAMMKLFHA